MIRTALFSFLITIAALSPNVARAARLGVFPVGNSPPKRQRLTPPTSVSPSLSAPSHLTYSPFELDQAQGECTCNDHNYSTCPTFLAAVKECSEKTPPPLGDENNFTREMLDTPTAKMMYEYHKTLFRLQR